MIEFIDKTSTQKGTPINRTTLMGIQGFVAKTTVFEDDGSITETNAANETLTTTFGTNSITETFRGKYTVTKTTTFDDEGNITEVLSQ